MQSCAPAALVWSIPCSRPCVCAISGEDWAQCPLGSCGGTSLIRANSLLDGGTGSFSCLLCFLLRMYSQLDQHVNKGLIKDRKWIIWKLGELHLLLPGRLQSAVGEWICQPMSQSSSCSQPFSGKNLQFKSKLVCFPIVSQSVNVFTCFYFVVVKPRNFNSSWDSLVMKLSLGAGGLKKNAMYVRNIDMLLYPLLCVIPAYLISQAWSKWIAQESLP